MVIGISVYIAAPYPTRWLAQELATRLRRQNLAVTSRWLDGNAMSDTEARKDLEDIRLADCFLAYNPPEYEQAGTGGRHVELGYALAIGKPIILLGERSNIFHHLTDVHQEFNDVSTMQLAHTIREMVLKRGKS